MLQTWMEAEAAVGPRPFSSHHLGPAAQQVGDGGVVFEDGPRRTVAEIGFDHDLEAEDWAEGAVPLQVSMAEAEPSSRL